MERAKNLLVSLLRWSEKYTKTDMLYLAKGGFWMAMGQAVSYASLLALALAFANFIPQEVYGQYKYVLSIAGIFAIFTLPGMSTAIARAVARGEETTVRAATRARVLWSFGGVMFALLLACYYHFIGGNALLATAFLIVAATLPFLDTFTLFDSYLLGKRRFKTQTAYYALTQAVCAPILIGALYFTDSLLLILTAYFAPLILTRFAIHHVVLRNTPSTPFDSTTLVYGKHLTAMNILGVVSGNIDKILLWHFLGPIQLAVYTFALAVPEQVKGPIKAVAELAFPKFAAQTPEQVRDNLPALKRKMFLYALVLIAASLLYLPVAPFIYQIFFPQYVESILYSQVYMLAAFALVGSIPLSILEAHKKIREQYLFTTVQPIMQTIFYVALIPFFGVMGAIIAKVLVRLFYVTYTFRLLKKSF